MDLKLSFHSTSSWDDAYENMNELIDDLNRAGYKFNRDFILKTCLTVLDKGPAYNVKKFRDDSTKQNIMSNWGQISNAIKDVKDYLWGQTYIRSDKALSSYLVLIPPIYFRYRYEDKWSSIKNLDDYILRTLITGAFSGNPDNLIDRITKEIKLKDEFIVEDIYGIIRSTGRNLEIEKDHIFNQYYGSEMIHLIFNMLYSKIDYNPSFKNNLPEIYHIFPKSVLSLLC